MAVGAILCRTYARSRVRKMRIESLAAVTFGRKCLLLRVDPLAICILRADHDRARRSDHGHVISFDRAIDPEHEDIIAYDLRIVGREVPVRDAFELILRDALVSFHGQMTSETTRRPGGVTNLAIHRGVIVREFYPSLFRREVVS